MPDGSGTLWRSTDGAHTFTRVLKTTDTGYLGSLVAHNDTVWVIANKPSRAGDVFVVYRSADGRKTWTITASPRPADLPTCRPADALN
jgi:hypothetical protein